jgi:hypothetical protein
MRQLKKENTYHGGTETRRKSGDQESKSLPRINTDDCGSGKSKRIFTTETEGKSLTRMSSDQNPDEPPESPLPKVKTILLAHAIAAEDRPALEHLLISF